MNKLDQMGYKVYRAKHAEYTRVGFHFKCDPNDLMRPLQEARQKLHPKSWYLVPPLKI